MRDDAAAPIKRSVDVVASVVLLLALSWLFILVSLAIAVGNGRPVLYAHRRVGRHGRTFSCWKFRSMSLDADLTLDRLLRCNPSAHLQWQHSAKLHHDPRVTPVGRFLRRSCLDELPQLWNVLKGDMSLVGPRPVTQAELQERYGVFAADYLRMRPGMTGAWQVRGRGQPRDSYDNRVRLDVRYCRQWSLRDDLRLLWATPGSVLRGALRDPAPLRSAPAAPRKKIVHVLTRFLRAGSEDNTLDTCMAQIASGHEVVVVHGAVFDDSYVRAMRRPGLRFHCLPSLVHPVAPLSDLWALWRFTAWLKDERPDVVHTHQSKAGIVGRLAARLAKVPHIVHGIHIVPFDNVSRLSKSLYVAMEKLAARRTDAFVSVSGAVRDQYLQRGIGPAEKHFVVPSGMPLQRFANAQPLRGDALWWHYATRPMVVLMLASYEPRKRHAQLLTHFQSLAQRNPNVHLIFAGSGKRQRVQALVDTLGLHHRVSVLACHPKPEALIALADVCVLSSRTEGLPRVVVQYLAAGKPVVVSCLPGIEDLVRSGLNGWVTSATDLGELVHKVEWLVNDAGTLGALTRGARASCLAPWDSLRTGANMAVVYSRLTGLAA